MEGVLRLLDQLAHVAADALERKRAADAADLARIRAQFAQDQARIAAK